MIRGMKGTGLIFIRWVLLAVIVLAGWVHYRGVLSSVVVHIQKPDGETAHILIAPFVSPNVSNPNACI